MKSYKSGIEAFMTEDKEKSSQQNDRLQYFNPLPGRTEIYFLSDFSDKDSYPKTVMFRGYQVPATSRNGKTYRRTYAYEQGDSLHPKHIEESEANERDPYRNMRYFGLALVFNITGYMGQTKKEQGKSLKKLEKVYMDNAGEYDDFSAPLIWQFGGHIKKGIGFFIEELEDDEEPSLHNYIFNLDRQGEGQGTSYTLTPSKRYEELDEEIRQVIESIPENHNLRAPEELLDFKRYNPEREGNAQSGTNSDGISPEYSISKLSKVASGSEDDDDDNW